MRQTQQTTLEVAYAAFAEKLKWLRERHGLSQADLEREMKKRGRAVSQKSVSNIERGEHDSQISNFAALAEHFGVPLWVMLIPGLDTSLLEGDNLKRLVRLVEDYLKVPDGDRAHIENMAAGLARLNTKK
jgi:transcriptional regulator with XRE-family HTH domain